MTAIRRRQFERKAGRLGHQPDGACDGIGRRRRRLTRRDRKRSDHEPQSTGTRRRLTDWLTVTEWLGQVPEGQSAVCPNTNADFSRFMAVCRSTSHIWWLTWCSSSKQTCETSAYAWFLFARLSWGVAGVVNRKDLQTAPTVYNFLRIVACELHTCAEFRFQQKWLRRSGKWRRIICGQGYNLGGIHCLQLQDRYPLSSEIYRQGCQHLPDSH